MNTDRKNATTSRANALREIAEKIEKCSYREVMIILAAVRAIGDSKPSSAR